MFYDIYAKRTLVITLLSLLAARLSRMAKTHKQNLLEQHEPLVSMDAVILGQNVTRLRKKAKITKHKFALMLDIGRPFLNRIESGEADSRLSVIRRLADALETTPQELLTQKTSEQQPPSAPLDHHHARLL